MARDLSNVTVHCIGVVVITSRRSQKIRPMCAIYKCLAVDTGGDLRTNSRRPSIAAWLVNIWNCTNNSAFKLLLLDNAGYFNW